LIGMLRSANQSTHRPKTFVGVMHFPRGSLPSSLDDGCWLQNAHTQAESPSGVGDAFSLRLDLPDIPSGVARSSASENAAELTSHFGWQSNHLHVAVRDDDSPPGALGPAAWELFRSAMLMGMQECRKIIALDMAACSSVITLQHWGAYVMVNGPWTMCNLGLFVMRAGTAAVINALDTGVPCVICTRHATACCYPMLLFLCCC